MKNCMLDHSRPQRVAGSNHFRFKLLVVWLSFLWLLIQIQVKAQNCEKPLPHGATWYGVCDNSVLQAGDPVFLCWGWNAGDIKKVKVEIIQNTGFRDNQNCQVTNETVYFREAVCDNYQSDREICEDVLLCPKTGSFTVVITLALKGSFTKKCPRNELTTRINFTILPDMTIPVPSNKVITFACPNKETRITVDNTQANQNGVDWFKDPVCLTPMPGTQTSERDAYYYPLTLPTGGTWNGYPSYYKSITKTFGTYRLGQPARYEQKSCKLHGTRIPYTAIAASIGTAISPDPVYRVICNNDPVSFQIENPLGQYDGVYWYTSPSGGPSIHTGFTYTSSFPANYTVLYIAYFKKYGEECEDVSPVKSPVIVVNLKSIADQASSSSATKPVLRQKAIIDYRDVGGLSCNDPAGENKYWIDLESVEAEYDASKVETAILDAVEALNVLGGPIQVHAQISGEYWQAFDPVTKTYVKNNIYLAQQSQKIVCSDYICSQGQSTSRRYEKVGSVSFSYTFTDPITGKVRRESDLICGIRKLAMIDVQSNHPQETAEEKCKTLTLEDLQKYSVGTASLTKGCDNIQLISACPGNTYTIGPEELEVNAMYVAKGGIISPIPIPGLKYYDSVQWTPVTGLSSATDIRPSLPFTGIAQSANGGNFIRYDELITFKNGKTANHCTIIYKCLACGPALDDSALK